jgi:hypothetical protein
MRSEFSEFSYGYAVTEELINWHGVGLRAYPYFPNLREEATRGYDLRLDRAGAPLFLQFKLADGMQRRSCVEIKKHSLPLTPVFYRMYVMRSDKSPQHSLLINLEGAGAEVYYVTPRFHTSTEFSNLYFSRNVVQNSAFIRPSAIGALPDAKQHHVSYERGGSLAWFCSEPVLIKEGTLDGSSLANNVLDTLNQSKPLTTQLKSLLSKILRTLEERGITPPFPPDERRGEFDDARRLNRISFLARQYFDCQFVIVQHAKKS